jgi:hypothetical protein
MHHTVCHKLRDILNRLDSILIHNTFLTAAPTPSAGMGLNIVHFYIARNSVSETQKYKYDIFVDEVKDAQSSYYTFPNEKTHAVIEEPDTQWLFLETANDSFRYDSYAALHLLKAKGHVPEKRNKANTGWTSLNTIVINAGNKTEMIGARMTHYLNKTIIPYLEEHNPDVLR